MKIEVHELTKRYGATLSIDGLSFDVPEGEIAGLLGPNGAGKSTTIRILTGLARASGGSAKIGGLDVQHDHAKIRARLGYLPELAPAYPDMTVESFLLFVAGAKGMRGSEADVEVRRVLGFLDLRRWAPRLIRNLSKGTRQRVGIAQSLLGRPSLVILDEPTAGLDPAQIQEVRALLKSLRGECTIFLSTHILPEVELTCDRVVIITGGRLMCAGTVDELRHGPAGDGRDAVTAQVRGPQEKLIEAARAACPDANITTTPGEGETFVLTASAPAGDAAWRSRLAAAIIGAGGELHSLEVHKPTLEEIYMRAVRQDQERGGDVQASA